MIAGVAVGDERRPDRVHQSVELLRVPAVVLVGEGDELRLAGREPQCALEVVEEARVGARRCERMNRGSSPTNASSAAKVSGDESSSLITQTQSSICLLPDRFDLLLEQVQRGLVGGHADRDPRSGCGSPSRVVLMMAPRPRAAELDRTDGLAGPRAVVKPRHELDANRAEAI